MKKRLTITCSTSNTGLLILFCFGFFTQVLAQQTYEVDVTGSMHEIRKGHLDLGGKSITGETIEVNSFYIVRNGKPFIPVIGEFHYSRYPNQYWDEQLKKMKAGGITVVSTYVFWNLHERTEDVFNWEGDLNLRGFVELCRNNGFDVIVRIGPFAHGEMRNGGLPDWLYGRDFEVRSNDPTYLYFARKLYNEIGKQLQGLYFSDGGPVIGVQIENEYQHSAAPWAITYLGAEKEYTTALIDRKNTKAGVGVNADGNFFASYGQKHMQILKQMAVSAGLKVPIYTATGWGYATIINNGSIPVMAGYAFPFWEEDNTLSPFYLYKNIHKNPDYAPVSYESELYPSLAAELGTGMIVTYSRRPRVPGESFLPLMVRTLGSGTNGLGYYMYHGGTTPSNGLYFFSEGFGLPNKSYDYQAPIREFGNPGKGFFSLKLINLFLQHYGTELAPLQTKLPETNANITPSDTTTLRYAIRSDGTKGFLFMHNYQDHLKTPDLKGIQLKIKTSNETISFPAKGTFSLLSGVSAIFPFNLQMNGLLLKSATAQPLCSFVNSRQQYRVFFSFDGIQPEFVFRGNPKVHILNANAIKYDGNTVITGTPDSTFEFLVNNTHFLVLPYKTALNAYLTGKPEQQYLIMSDALVLENDENIDLISMGKETIHVSVYPLAKSLQSDIAKVSSLKTAHNFLSEWTVSVNSIKPDIVFSRPDDRRYVMNARKLDLSILNDIYIKFDYIGDRAVCMLNGEMATDNLYTSEPWLIGLKRYKSLLKDNLMYFYFVPMSQNAPYLSYLDREVIPDFTKSKEFLEIKTPEIIPEYKISITIK